jgi:tRNA-Thr(GGU) m(6)t(6)A37 methyltransferase TsaA
MADNNMPSKSLLGLEKNMETTLKFIGHINTPYNAIEECPNNIERDGPLCQLIVDNDFQDGLLGLKQGQEILILYWFENADRNVTQQESSDGEDVIGTFALRSPHRPNPIAAAVLPIEAIDSGSVSVKGLDCLNGTRLLDIKPAIKNELSN